MKDDAYSLKIAVSLLLTVTAQIGVRVRVAAHSLNNVITNI